MVDTEHLRILMATRNGAPWIGAQLESLLAQDFTNWSLWVSDDGSTDETRDILEAFSRAHPGRLEHLGQGPGQGSAKNFLHLLTLPDLPPGPVALADQDDVWRPHKLRRAVQALSLSRPEVPAAYASRFYVVDEHLGQQRLSRLWPRGASFENALVQNVMSGHSTVLNNAALQIVRRAGMQDVPYHDWWIYQLMAGTGSGITLDPEPTLFYRQHGENVLGSSKGLRAWDQRRQQMRSRQFAGWVARNCRGLDAARTELGAQAITCLDAFTGLPASGVGRALGLKRLGIHRQSSLGTGLIYLAAMRGQV